VTECPRLETVGVYVLGALDEDERSDYATHLETCAECRREFERLAHLPALLELVREPVAVGAPTEAEERLVARLRRHHDTVPRWRRTPVVAAGAGLLGAAAAATVVLGFGLGDDTNPPTPVIQLAPASPSVAASAWATAKLHPRTAGTIVDFEAGGLPQSSADERYIVQISERGKVVAQARFTVNANGWAQIAVTTLQKLYPDAQLEVRRDAPGQPLVLRSTV
jgi:anti-sigma factor RsiW